MITLTTVLSVSGRYPRVGRRSDHKYARLCGRETELGPEAWTWGGSDPGRLFAGIPGPSGPHTAQFPMWKEGFEGISGYQGRPPEEVMFEPGWED